MKLSDIKPNPSNPRVIKDDKFHKLVKSIKDFPEMLSLRPMIIDEHSIVLGGNMRLKALQELGYKDIPDEWVMKASDLNEDQKRQFIIKDNIGFGEWEWETLANEWDVDELRDWGLDIPNYSTGHDINSMTDEDVDIEEDFDPVGTMDGKQRVVFLFDGPDEAESYLNSLKVDFKKMNMAWQVDLSTQSI
jgi:hypothetical protein